jgi:hypothetical protein
MHGLRGPAFLALTLLTALFVAAPELSVRAQSPGGRPGPPTSGGFSPFRGPGVKGTSFEAASLEQPGCPLHLTIEALRRTEGGVTLSLRLSNLVEGPITRQIVGAWVLVPDGTVRGYQKLETDRTLQESALRVVDLYIRTVPVLPNDVIVVAIQEARGQTTWRRDVKDLQEEVRTAILK